MRKIRVFVVDDSAVVRRVLVDVLASDPEFEVVGTASNGVIALMNIGKLAPDVVTLDVEMPEMDGLRTLAAIRERFPKLHVIMFSSRTQRGAVATIEALSLGAADYVTKPADAENPTDAARQVRDQLVPKIRALFAVRHDATASTVIATPQQLAPPALSKLTRLEVVAIGVSTGGPNALDRLVPAFPADFPLPILIVQHMPELFTRSLAERLASRSSLAVREAASGETVVPGAVLIAPGGRHLEVARAGGVVKTVTHSGEPENSCRPAVDVLFRSVAEVYGFRSLTCVMTGMGQDGLAGVRRIRAVGGAVLAQDEATSVVWGMPGMVARAGLADKVLPLDELAPEIIRRAKVGRERGTESR